MRIRGIVARAIRLVIGLTRFGASSGHRFEAFAFRRHGRAAR